MIGLQSAAGRARDSFENTPQVLIVCVLAIVSFGLLYSLRVTAPVDDDVLVYAIAARDGSPLFHPHHLFYPALMHLFYLAFAPVASCGALCVTQAHSLAWGVISVVCVYILVRELVGSAVGASAAAVFTLITNGFWLWSTQGEPYAAFLGSLLLLTVLLVRRGSTPFDWKHTAIASGLLAMSIFYHQAAVLYVVPLGYYLIAQRGRDGLAAYARILVLSGSVALGAYLVVFHSSVTSQTHAFPRLWAEVVHAERSVGEFIHWILEYSRSGMGWGTLDHLGTYGLRTLLHSQLQNIVVVPELPWGLHRAVKLAVALMLAAIFLWNLWKTATRSSYYQVRVFFLIWWVLYSLFFLWWLPGLRQFIIPNIVPIVGLASLFVRDLLSMPGKPYTSKGLVAVSLGSLAILVFTLNLFASVLPAHVWRDSHYDEAARLNSLAGERCAILTTWRVALNLDYYFNRESLLVDEELGKYYAHSFDKTSDDGKSQVSPCAVVALHDIAPDRRVNGTTGYDRPAQWLRFAEWFFDVRNEPASKALSYGDVSVAFERGSVPYVSVDRLSRARAVRTPALFRSIDERVNRIMGEERNVFSSWVRTCMGDRNAGSDVWDGTGDLSSNLAAAR